jgi:hypothetical protein
MRPQDLLHAVRFDFKLIPSWRWPHITGVQVSCDENGVVCADVRIGQELLRFQADRSTADWRTV